MTEIDAQINAAEPDVWAIIRGAVDSEAERVCAALDRLQQAGGDPLVFAALCGCLELVKLVWKDELANSNAMVIVDKVGAISHRASGLDEADGLAVARFAAAYCNGDMDTTHAVWGAAVDAGPDRQINLVFGLIGLVGRAGQYLAAQQKRGAE